MNLSGAQVCRNYGSMYAFHVLLDMCKCLCTWDVVICVSFVMREVLSVVVVCSFRHANVGCYCQVCN